MVEKWSSGIEGHSRNNVRKPSRALGIGSRESGVGAIQLSTQNVSNIVVSIQRLPGYSFPLFSIYLRKEVLIFHHCEVMKTG